MCSKSTFIMLAIMIIAILFIETAQATRTRPFTTVQQDLEQMIAKKNKVTSDSLLLRSYPLTDDLTTLLLSEIPGYFLSDDHKTTLFLEFSSNIDVRMCDIHAYSYANNEKESGHNGHYNIRTILTPDNNRAINTTIAFGSGSSTAMSLEIKIACTFVKGSVVGNPSAKATLTDLYGERLTSPKNIIPPANTLAASFSEIHRESFTSNEWETRLTLTALSSDIKAGSILSFGELFNIHSWILNGSTCSFMVDDHSIGDFKPTMSSDLQLHGGKSIRFTSPEIARGSTLFIQCFNVVYTGAVSGRPLVWFGGILDQFSEEVKPMSLVYQRMG